MYDVICFGSISADHIIRITSLETVNGKLCVELGAKELIDEIVEELGGGGFNNSCAFSKIGLKTALLGKLGKDTTAEKIIQTLKKYKIDFIGAKGKVPSGNSFIISKPGHDRAILVFKGANNDITEKDIPFNKLKSKWFHFGRMLEKSWNTQLKAAKKLRGASISFNPSQYVAEKGIKTLKPLLKEIKLLILNNEEAQALTGKKADKITLLKILHEIVPEVVITDGKKGAHAIYEGKIYEMIPTQVKVVERTGAGDAFSSGYVSAKIMKKNTPTALLWGATLANSVIQEYGAIHKLLTMKQIIKNANKNGKVKEIKC